MVGGWEGMMVVPEEIIAVVFVAVDSASLRKMDEEEEEGERDGGGGGGGSRSHHRRDSERRIWDDGARSRARARVVNVHNSPTRKFVSGVSETCELDIHTENEIVDYKSY